MDEILEQLEEDFRTIGIQPYTYQAFNSLLKQNPIKTMRTVLQLFSRSYGKTVIYQLQGLLQLLRVSDYNLVKSSGVMIATSCLLHWNDDVVASAIACFASWKPKCALQKLKAANYSARWVREYAQEVIEKLESEEDGR